MTQIDADFFSAFLCVTTSAVLSTSLRVFRVSLRNFFNHVQIVQ